MPRTDAEIADRLRDVYVEPAHAERIQEAIAALERRAPAVTLTDGERQALRIVADHCAGYLNARNIVYAMLDRMAQAAVTYTKCTCADPACNWYLRAPSEAKP